MVDSLVQQPDGSSVDKTTDLAAMYTIIFLSTATTHIRRSLYVSAIISVLDLDNRGSG